MTTDTEARELVERLRGFTPGPWRVGPVDDTRVEARDGSEVAQIDGDYNQPETWPVMESNASLIAAAPDMHRLLTALLAENERLREPITEIVNLLWSAMGRQEDVGPHGGYIYMKLRAALKGDDQ